ncbi:hypothetical protein E1B28_011769 [Marasmius oreades]|uniref:Uncharacterized protein n=1 Tax=Marasmius oreades TaxID=181124 RepID=A0A9P7RUS4_9AGAR|nr:uncharacterized protein E1B28_011769 [Marasmius oreades]KAG7090161.1 hypothetical protein E1B28_011769 [Marasmius oreades]
MEMFTAATRATINRSHFSNVGRDQNNYTTIHQTIVQTRGKRKAKKDVIDLSDYTEIKRGDIYKDKDVCYSWRLCSNASGTTEAAVYTAEIMIAGRFGTNKFTVKTYHGRNAMKEWKRDFQRCSQDWRGNVPVFGYSKTTVPLLIFHGELVPLAHIEPQLVRFAGFYYVNLLIGSLGCTPNELWMDPIRGKFCRGPIGPECRGPYYDRGAITIPSDVEFLGEDMVVRYLSNTQYDFWCLNALSFCAYIESPSYIDTVIDYPQAISGQTGSTIAFTRNVRWWKYNGCLGKGQVMIPFEVTAFRLTDNGRDVGVFSDSESSSWLSQALSIFHTRNISLDEDLSNYKYIYTMLELTGTLQKSKRKRQRRQLCGPIYLILRHHQSPFAPSHFWSFDPTGQFFLSPDTCKYLGLPFKLCLHRSPHQRSWPTKVYNALRDYQIAKGFDPRTTDFAYSHYYFIYEFPVPHENRFQLEIEEEETEILSGSRDSWPTATSSGLTCAFEDDIERPDDSFSLELLFDRIQVKGENFPTCLLAD